MATISFPEKGIPPHRQTPHKPRIGDRVVINVGSDLEGVIVEERGTIGVHGRPLYRIAVNSEEDITIYYEIPESAFMTEHPILLYFGDTKNRDFPLILVIGREPNTTLPIVNTMDAYDFREYPNAMFWNMAYSTIARCSGNEGSWLKKKCATKNCSPILFANALPIGIEANVSGNYKLQQRRIIDSDTAREHIDNIFSFDSIITRVQIVLASGHNKPEFSTPNETIKKACKKRGIDFINLPYFGRGTNNFTIDDSIEEKEKDKIKSIIYNFLK